MATGHDPDNSIVSEKSQTALHLAVACEQWSIATLLVLWSANVEKRDSDGRNILHYLAATEAFSLSFLISVLRRPIDLSIPDKSGSDPMGLAIGYGHGDFVTILRMFQHDQAKRRNPSATNNIDNKDEDIQVKEPVIKIGDSPRGQINAPKKGMRKYLRHYPRFYRKLQHHRSSSSGNQKKSSSSRGEVDHIRFLSKSMSHLNPFNGHKPHASHVYAPTDDESSSGSEDKSSHTSGTINAVSDYGDRRSHRL